MNCTKISDEAPELNESIVLSLNYRRARRLKFWKKKIIVFGWLQQVKETRKGTEYKFYDQTNNCFWKSDVTHWMVLPQPPE